LHSLIVATMESLGLPFILRLWTLSQMDFASSLNRVSEIKM